MTDTSSKEEFIEAVKNDEYAEYELENGYVLCTDVEYDGAFVPWVEPSGKIPNSIRQEQLKATRKEIEETFDCSIYGMLYDGRQDVIYPENMSIAGHIRSRKRPDNTYSNGNDE
jgi:hypothetical protein